MLSLGIAMTTNIQLNVSHTLSDYLENVSTDFIKQNNSDISSEQRAITYIMIYTFINTIARWTIGKIYIQKMEFQLYGQNLRPSEIARQKQISLFQKIYSYINPPIAAALLALLTVLIVPEEYMYLFKDTTTFSYRTVFSGIYLIGRTQPPIVLMILGSNLFLIYQQYMEKRAKEQLIQQNKQQIKQQLQEFQVDQQEKQRLTQYQQQSQQQNLNKQSILSQKSSQLVQMPEIKSFSLFGILIVKLIIMPITGCLILHSLYQMGFYDDPVLAFVAIISFSTPTAINLLIICSIYSEQLAVEVSKILLLGYLSYIVTLPIVMVTFFSALI